MQVIKTSREIGEVHAYLERNSLKSGFIPTMGALHDGHLSLIRAAAADCDVTIASVFVNPTQFNDPSDFEKYPRQTDEDLRKLRSVDVDYVFLPDVTEIYPAKDATIYELGEVAEVIEGVYRPGHFNGVASVVKRLLELVQPDRAYFGLKDYQQFLIIRNLVEKYRLGVEIIGCPIIRDASGLAMSSRNQLLSPQGKNTAACLATCLKRMRAESTSKNATQLEKQGWTYLQSVEGVRPEYVTVVNKDTLRHEPAAMENRIALVAAYVEGVRLIDNMFIDN